MSMTPDEWAWEEAMDRLSEELYPAHKEQAIDEFTNDRLQSFYLTHREILQPGIARIRQAGELAKSHPSASYVFSTTAIELFLKAALLKPVVYGLVHNHTLAEVVVEETLGYSGFERYKKLLSKLFEELARIDIARITRAGSTIPLLTEAEKIQNVRNGIIHRGEDVTEQQARHAEEVASAVLDVVLKMLAALGLKVDNNGGIEVR